MSIKLNEAESNELNLGKLLEKHPDLQIEKNDYNINVTANYGEKLTQQDVYQKYLLHDGAKKPTHLYFHVPICSYICHFCNYVKQLLPEDGNKTEVLDQWTELLIEESNRYLKNVAWISKAKIESFYMGGGTSSLLSPVHLKKIISHVRDNYHVSDDCELSLEGNPDNYQNDELEQAIKIGFNRFSVGVQSLQNEVNQFVGRKHDRDMSLNAIHKLLETGKPFNVDIMFGLPYQTPKSVAADIRILCQLGVPTITIYRLRNSDRQSMGIGNRSAWNIPSVREKIEEKGLFPTLLQTYEMREEILKVFMEFGYQPSPCGWWSKPNVYPEGNIPRVSRNKWQRYDSMIAYGPGAYGWLTGGSDQVIQTHNIPDIKKYIEHMKNDDDVPLAYGRILSGHEAVASALGFNFKSNQPIDLGRFRNQYGVDLLEDEPYQTIFSELEQKELVSINEKEEVILPTVNGEALHEEIISVYFHQKIGSYAEPLCRRF
ncbi:radical SAM protein [Peribacillus muralis]|uniref:radical SAM protein n=1 Tax=Peribacillus muralis TaxID=264697 RepID=UPI001F4E7797|nr:radical SAM protein [Peribacillus muralis]MCK1993195.1 radical SAM protein [Peribacillus muralis]MCK2013749.1 radical SAM protein [Peribacillus muralis]